MKSNILKIALLFLIVCLTGCNDDNLLYDSGNMQSNATRAAYDITDSKIGLVPQEDGTYRATRRIPLVGQGRIVDNVMNSLVTVGATDTHAENVVDLDLTNTAIPKGNAIGAQVAYNSILSVRDINYVYSGGQKAGFVVKTDDSGLLTLDVLKGFSLSTYLRGEKQEENPVTEDSGLLSLGLGKISVNDSRTVPYTLEAEFSKPFDEIRLSNNGIKADAATTGIEIYYAFVGETPEIKAINDGNEYFNNKCTGKFDGVNNKELVDASTTNGPAIFLVAAGTFEVDFGREVPANSEIGFYLTSASLLNLDVAGTVAVQSLDENGDPIDKMSTTTVVNLGLATGGALTYSLTTSKPCHGVKIIFGGLPINVGGIQCHYAFVREPVIPDISSYFTFSNATVYTPGYHLPTPKQDGASVTYTLVSAPSGANAEIKQDKGILWNMNIPGNYVVKATYSMNGETYTQMATITRKVRVDTDCNQKLVNNDGSEVYKAYIPESWGINIGSQFEEGLLKNVTDENTNNYFAFNNAVGINLIKNTGIIGVKKENGKISNGKPIRVGFVVNNDQTILNANVLNFFRIKLLNNGQEVTTQVADGAISVSLIKSLSNPLTRFSMLVKDGSLEFDAIELYYTGLADVTISQSLHIFYAFVDHDVNSCPDPGQECMQLITNGSYSATASFDVKGLLTAGVTVTNLGNIVDGRLDSYATVASPAAIGTEVSIKTEFDPIQGGTAIGFILKNDIDVVKLIDLLKIVAYNGDTKVAEAEGGGALNITLGSDKYKYLYLTPPASATVNRMDLIIGQGLSLGEGMNICGIFSRPDLDGNGFYDCLDDEASANIKNVILKTPHLCGGEKPVIEVEGGEDNKVYILTLTSASENATKFYVYIDDDGSVTPTKTVRDKNGNVTTTGSDEEFAKFFKKDANCGIYTISLTPDKAENAVQASSPLYIHPTQTAWKGTKDENWKDWDNWDNGEPWDCTDVVIPSPSKQTSKQYPALSQNEDYYCQNIHFEAGAMLKGQSYLHYSGTAYVDIKVTAGDYRLMSAPLQGMVTGDMFTDHSGWNSKLNGQFNNGKWNTYANYFTQLIESNYPEKRTNPTVYQRFWDENVETVTMTRSLATFIIPEFKDWTRAFNAVATPYDKGQGFAIRVGKDGDSGEYVLHFPKSHTRYYYCDIAGNKLNQSENIARGISYGKLWTGNKVVLERRSEGKLFLFGNPFMTCIDIAKLINGNSSISRVITYETGKYKYDVTSGFIKPMEAVFIEVNDGFDGKSLTLNINENMLSNSAN